VKDFTFLAPDLKSLIESSDSFSYEQVYLMNGKNDLLNPKVYGVESNLLSSIATEYFFLHEANPKYEYEKLQTGEKDVVKKMNELYVESSEMQQFDRLGIIAP